MIRHTRVGVFAAAALLASACAPNLDVKNLDAPDVLRALATPEDVKSISASAINTWYIQATAADGPNMLAVTADVATCNYGNNGMRFSNVEPRIAWDNTSAYAYRAATENPWNYNYGALGAANDAMKAFKAGVQLTSAAETDQYKTLAMFGQALSLSELGLVFDKAFVVDENSTGLPTLVPYTDVITASLAKWDAVIAASAGKTYVFPSSVLPLDKVTLSGANLNRIANTMAARTLAYAARTQAETDALSWARVLAYADKGISGATVGAPIDFTVVGDGGNVWYAEGAAYVNSTWGMGVDQRVINEMSPNVPAKFAGTIVAPGAVHDARLGNDAGKTYASGLPDFTYVGFVWGTASRGLYMQTSYQYMRYFSYGWDADISFLGPYPFTMAAENDLLIAEALVRTSGDLARAATLINRTRVTRGALAPAAAGDGKATLLADIAYERDVELFTTGGNRPFYDRRRIDGLQPGTPRHFPVPGKELETLGLPIYTFGGPTNLAGK